LQKPADTMAERNGEYENVSRECRAFSDGMDNSKRNERSEPHLFLVGRQDLNNEVLVFIEHLTVIG